MFNDFKAWNRMRTVSGSNALAKLHCADVSTCTYAYNVHLSSASAAHSSETQTCSNRVLSPRVTHRVYRTFSRSLSFGTSSRGSLARNSNT